MSEDFYKEKLDEKVVVSKMEITTQHSANTCKTNEKAFLCDAMPATQRKALQHPEPFRLDYCIGFTESRKR